MKELRILNLICIIAAVGFLALAVLNALLSGDFLTTDNLFITTVCLVMALTFAANPLLYLKSEGKLPIPFMKRHALAASGPGAPALPSGPPMLDAKGRAMPPDVKSMVNRMRQGEPRS